MLTTILTAAAAGGAKSDSPYGFWEALQQGGIIAWSVAGILTIMLFVSLYIFFVKIFEQSKINAQTKRVRSDRKRHV